MRWRLYYADGREYDGESSEDAFAVPATGIQLMKQEADCPRGYSLRHSAKFYCWEHIRMSDGPILDECRWGTKNDIFGLMHYYMTHPGPQKVLIGIEIHDATYQAISSKAAKDGCLCTTACNHVRG